MTDNVKDISSAGCRFCDALASLRDEPAVMRLLDALRDEATVALMLRTGRVEPPLHRVRGDDRKRMLRALSFGSLLLREMVQEVYPTPSRDPEETELRAARVKAIAHRLTSLGVLVRLSRGRFALAEGGPRERASATMDDCRRILADPHVNPPGLTAKEVADRLDIPITTVQKWLERLRGRGAPIVVAPDPDYPRRYRYRVVPDARKEVA